MTRALALTLTLTLTLALTLTLSLQVELAQSDDEGTSPNPHLTLWQGPENTPCKVRVYIEDGRLRPFNAVLATPRGPNTVAVRNLGNIQFPIAATVFADTSPRPSRRPPPASGAWVEGMDQRVH